MRILPEETTRYGSPTARRHHGLWLQSIDVARMLEITPWSVRWLARTGQLDAANTTRSGMRLFKRDEVERLVQRRAQARLDSVSAYRPRLLPVAGQPRQMGLFERPVTLFRPRGSAAKPSTEAWVHRPGSFRESA